jgi:hypothetical protein
VPVGSPEDARVHAERHVDVALGFSAEEDLCSLDRAPNFRVTFAEESLD